MRTATSWAAFRGCCAMRRLAHISAGTSPPRTSTRIRTAITSAAWCPSRKTKADRMANGDPRLSLEERYGNHAGYVAAVTAAAQRAVDAGFLLPADMAAPHPARAARNAMT